MDIRTAETKKRTCPTLRQTELRKNFSLFKSIEDDLLPRHQGRFAVVVNCQIAGIVDSVGEAYQLGLQLTDDHLFSIQEIGAPPVYI